MTTTQFSDGTLRWAAATSTTMPPRLGVSSLHIRSPILRRDNFRNNLPAAQYGDPRQFEPGLGTMPPDQAGTDEQHLRSLAATFGLTILIQRNVCASNLKRLVQ